MALEKHQDSVVWVVNQEIHSVLMVIEVRMDFVLIAAVEFDPVLVFALKPDEEEQDVEIVVVAAVVVVDQLDFVVEVLFFL